MVEGPWFSPRFSTPPLRLQASNRRSRKAHAMALRIVLAVPICHAQKYAYGEGGKEGGRGEGGGDTGRERVSQ